VTARQRTIVLATPGVVALLAALGAGHHYVAEHAHFVAGNDSASQGWGPAVLDTNGDGTLSDEEKQAAKAAYAEQAGDFKQRMLERFDADGDGTLSETERQAAKEAYLKHGGGRPGANGKDTRPAGRSFMKNGPGTAPGKSGAGGKTTSI